MPFLKPLFVGLDTLARRRVPTILLVAFLAFSGSWLWSLTHGIPVPYDVDEFSYLLAADTFTHGRVTNPTHPMWIHFEGFNILQQPSYMSKYPPGQGIFLATGQVLFGHPIYGVWLSVGAMCAAICWMLYAWVSPRWALIGGLAAVLQFGIFTYWSQSYWGGAVAAFGGALVFGALPRILKNRRIQDGLWLGLGCAVLLNSRPLEGFLVALPVGCLVLPWKNRDRHYLFEKKVLSAPIFILLLTILGMGMYNKQITGDPKVFPYSLYTQTLRSVPIFMWQPLVPRVKYDHKIMEIHERNNTERYFIIKKTWHGFVKDMQNDSYWVSTFFLGFLLAVPSLVFLIRLFFYHKTALRLWVSLAVLLVSCAVMTTPAKAHYFAPLTALVVLLIVVGLRRLSGFRLHNKRMGLSIVVFLIFLQLIFNIILTPVSPKVRSLACSVQKNSINLPGSFSREELKDVLIKLGGKYLVIVRYPLTHNYFYEWVYNDADIDHAPIVWARNMDQEHDMKLLEYFKDRQAVFINVFWDMPGFPHFQARQ